MNRRSFFRMGFGAGLAPLADKLVPLCLAAPVQKMDEPLYGGGIDPTLIELQKEMNYRMAMIIETILAVEGLT